MRETGDMVRVLEISADAADLEIDVRMAVKKKQKLTALPGFRIGRVPPKMIRQLYAKEIEEIVVEGLVKEVYEDMVLRDDELRQLGQSREIHRDYKLDGDLHVQIEFFVVPKIELKDVSEQVLEVPVIEMTDLDIQRFIEEEMKEYLTARPLHEDEKIGEKNVGNHDRVKVKVESIDQGSGYILLGQKDKDWEVSFDFASTYHRKPSYAAFGDTLVGRSIGEKFVLNGGDVESDFIETRAMRADFRVTILEAERYDWPEIDDEMASKISDGEVESADALEEWATEFVEEVITEWNHELVAMFLKERLAELNPFSIPPDLLIRAFEDDPEKLRGIKADSEAVLEVIRWGVLRMLIEDQMPELFDGDILDSDLDEEEREELLDDQIVSKLSEQFDVKQISIPKSRGRKYIDDASKIATPVTLLDYIDRW